MHTKCVNDVIYLQRYVTISVGKKSTFMQAS